MIRLTVLLVLILSLIGCKNILESGANKTSVEARLFQIETHLNNFEWSEAIGLYNDLPVGVRAQSKAKTLYISALMGRCGFEFVTFVNNFADELDDSGRLFLALLKGMPDSTAIKAADCIAADISIQELIADYGGQTSAYNMSLLNGLARIGSLINTSAADANNEPEAGFQACSSAAISDADVQQIVSAFARVISDIQYSSLSILGDSLSGLCDPGDPLEVTGVCEATDPTAVTPIQVCAMRSLINESQVAGLGTVCTGDISTCACVGCP